MAFCHLLENFVINMAKNWWILRRNRNRCCKNRFKKVVQKNAEATGDVIGNKIADKITLLGKSKEKEKPKKAEETYIPLDKRQQIIDDLKLFWARNLISFV